VPAAKAVGWQNQALLTQGWFPTISLCQPPDVKIRKSLHEIANHPACPKGRLGSASPRLQARAQNDGSSAQTQNHGSSAQTQNHGPTIERIPPPISAS
jgi:hypothetical protein